MHRYEVNGWVFNFIGDSNVCERDFEVTECRGLWEKLVELGFEAGDG